MVPSHSRSVAFSLASSRLTTTTTVTTTTHICLPALCPIPLRVLFPSLACLLLPAPPMRRIAFSPRLMLCAAPAACPSPCLPTAATSAACSAAPAAPAAAARRSPLRADAVRMAAASHTAAQSEPQTRVAAAAAGRDASECGVARLPDSIYCACTNIPPVSARVPPKHVFLVCEDCNRQVFPDWSTENREAGFGPSFKTPREVARAALPAIPAVVTVAKTTIARPAPKTRPPKAIPVVKKVEAKVVPVKVVVTPKVAAPVKVAPPKVVAVPPKTRIPCPAKTVAKKTAPVKAVGKKAVPRHWQRRSSCPRLSRRPRPSSSPRRLRPRSTHLPRLPLPLPGPLLHEWLYLWLVLLLLGE
ncbi:hypothetical protein BC831DRAFT_253752 [Entophlyctis helioformis]|nr:hypothetical protein BC831DRAFT_253752 [Entophlyctis helioformis]